VTAAARATFHHAEAAASAVDHGFASAYLQNRDPGEAVMMPAMRYLRWPLVVTALGLVTGFLLGFGPEGSLSAGLAMLFICTALAILEIALSFDNAIVNANKLKHMTPVWRQRFLTWGILIAVFGMRLVFPIAIVCVAAGIGPVEAIGLAVSDQARYAEIMHDAHPSIAAFGGAFLMMVALSYFFDLEKEVHWIHAIEEPIARFSSVKGLEIATVIAMVLAVSAWMPSDKAVTVMTSALWGLLTYLAVEMLGHILDRADQARSAAAQGGFGAFLYLEVLDASFSFDGVIGAFALSSNLFVIAIGLGIGAMYVRGMTVMLVEEGTLARYPFLEHGAFYSVLALAVAMFMQSLMHVPEVLTAGVGVVVILLALRSSIRFNRRTLAEAELRRAAE
jgi:hypothetical protein